MKQKFSFKRFYEPLIKKPSIGIKAGIYTLVSTGFILFSILILQQISYSIEIKDYSLLIKLTTIFSVVFLSTKIFEYFAHTWYGDWPKSSYEIRKIIYDEYIEKYIHLDNTKTEMIGTGKLISIIQNGVNDWGQLIINSLQKTISLLLNLGFTIYMISLTSWNLVLIFLTIIFFINYLFVYLNDKLVLPLRPANIDAKNSQTRYLVKIIMSKFEIAQSNKSKDETQKLNGLIDNHIKTNCDISKVFFFMFNIPTIFINSIYIILFLFIGKQVIDGTVSISVFVGYIVLLSYLRNTLAEFADFYKNFTKDISVVQKLRQTFDELKTQTNGTIKNHFLIKTGEIELKDIKFSYNERKSNFVLNNFNLNIHGGRKTALVGPSGSGKTTLIKLIAGYIQPEGGKVIVDTQDISQTILSEYYKNIGYLTQEPNVFDGTVLDNLLFGIIDYNEKNEYKINEVIRLAKCEFIYDLPQGLDTQIGERGVRLSGGQKQRLAIAKLMLKDPQIILLDEPTSAMDSFNEEEVSQALYNLFQGRTVIIVAHRLQTVKQADRIVYLENGKVVEEGTHQQLIDLGGKYKKMLDLQSGF